MADSLLFPSNLTLINATPFVWAKALNESSQMVEWDDTFPDQIAPGQILPVSLEFTTTDTQAAGSGTIVYTIVNDNSHNDTYFSILASAEQDDPLTVNSSGLSGNSPSSSMVLSWSSDNEAGTPFILAASSSNSAPSLSPNTPVDWMHQNLQTLGCQPLRRLCMPGAHDAGMSVLNSGTFLVTPQNTLTQWIDIAGQLDAGFRYFDMRPVIASGQFVMGHYSKIGDEWIGGNGQDLASVIDQINSFLSTNNELVILDLTHILNTDDGWRNLNSDEMSRLMTQLAGLKNRYSGPMPGNNDLSTLPLNTFIANGPSVLILSSDVAASPIPPSSPAGVFPGTSFKIFNQYSNTDNPAQMRNDQLSKLASNRKSRDDPIFLLSWTLSTVFDIRQLANQAHNMLFDSSASGFWQTIYNNKGTSYPNILLLDAVGAPAPDPMSGRMVAALSMAINHVALDGVACPA